jgi:hypothetical protein
MRIYYNDFSTITRYHFGGDLEAIGQISLTPDPILLNSLICYYEDLEEGIPFSGNFKNPKIYKEYRFEICDKYKDFYKGKRFVNKNIGEEILLNDKWIPIPDDFYESKKIYLLNKLIREDKYYFKKDYLKNFYYTDEFIKYYNL